MSTNTRSLDYLISIAALALVSIASPSVGEEIIFMSPEWASQACEAWNQDEILTGKLGKWMQNDLDRGYKIMQIYRRDCQESSPVEMRIEDREGSTECVYGGAVTVEELDKKADYLMFADTNRWQEMGEGKYGPMKAMMFGRLKFKGPKGEAMGNMGPFGNFLVLTGQVPSNANVCPGVS
jgi:putative sterol carrier protein